MKNRTRKFGEERAENMRSGEISQKSMRQKREKWPEWEAFCEEQGWPHFSLEGTPLVCYSAEAVLKEGKDRLVLRMKADRPMLPERLVLKWEKDGLRRLQKNISVTLLSLRRIHWTAKRR